MSIAIEDHDLGIYRKDLDPHVDSETVQESYWPFRYAKDHAAAREWERERIAHPYLYIIDPV